MTLTAAPSDSSASAARRPERRTPSRRWPTLTLLAALASMLAPFRPADALTIRVHPDSAAAGATDYVATILEANDLVSFGDSIEVSSKGSPYIHTAAMQLVDGVTYQGGFGPDFEGPSTRLFETAILLDLAADSTGSVLEAVTAGSGTIFAGFTITGGNTPFSGGGLQCGPGTAVTVRNCRFENNYADVAGGGIQITQSSTFVYNCDFVGNSSRLRGGGVSVSAGSDAARVEFCRFTACSTSTVQAPTGGGGALFTASGIVFTRNNVDSCWSGTDGGAILVRTATGFQCTDSWMFDNTADRNGGTILQDGGTASYYSLQMERGHAGASGGAAYFQGGTSNLSGSFVRECTATVGGGAFYYEEPVNSLVKTSEFVNNAAPTGGAIQIRGLPFARSHSLDVISNTFAFNSASDPDAGGGIHFEAGGFLDLVRDNVLALQLDGSGICCVGALNQPTTRYNCVYNDPSANSDPPYGGDCGDRTGISGNISQDPRFCDVDADPPQVGLAQFSPCLGSGEGGVDMGAHAGSACAVIAVERTSWSRIKSYYR